MTVAVIGAGFFGVSTALKLDQHGYDVDLYDQADDILTAASWGNQWRLHRGYHYPRAEDTARHCRDSAEQFEQEYPEAVLTDADHYYCIADDPQTKTTGEEYLAFCDRLGLDYEQQPAPHVNHDNIDLSVTVPEHRVDPHALKASCWSRLQHSDVSCHFGTRIDSLESLPHDYIVVATYAGINDLYDHDSNLAGTYKYELVEKPLVSLPPEYAETSVVVMDGPYMCFDPYGQTGNILLGNVVHSIHDTIVNNEPSFDAEYDTLLDSGLVRDPPLTKFEKFQTSAEPFIPGLTDANHLGSLYTIRTVLADVEDTDERPTIVQRDGNVFKLFSGKLAAALPAADQICDELNS